MTEPHWTQILSALLTPTIAVLGFFIAYRQWRTAQNKLKLDLFEKRFTIYEVASKFIRVAVNGRLSNDDIYGFRDGIRQSKWLLSDDVSACFDEILEKAYDLQCLEVALNEMPVGDERTKKVSSQRENKTGWEGVFAHTRQLKP